MAADHPKRFASVVPVCGGGDPRDAEKLKALPIWVFHGDQDSAFHSNVRSKWLMPSSKPGAQKFASRHLNISDTTAGPRRTLRLNCSNGSVNKKNPLTEPQLPSRGVPRSCNPTNKNWWSPVEMSSAMPSLPQPAVADKSSVVGNSR